MKLTITLALGTVAAALALPKPAPHPLTALKERNPTGYGSYGGLQFPQVLAPHHLQLQASTTMSIGRPSSTIIMVRGMTQLFRLIVLQISGKYDNIKYDGDHGHKKECAAPGRNLVDHPTAGNLMNLAAPAPPPKAAPPAPAPARECSDPILNRPSTDMNSSSRSKTRRLHRCKHARHSRLLYLQPVNSSRIPTMVLQT